MSKIYYLKKSCPIVEFSRFSTFFEQLQYQFKFLFFNFFEKIFTVIHINTGLCLAEEKIDIVLSNFREISFFLVSMDNDDQFDDDDDDLL